MKQKTVLQELISDLEEFKVINKNDEKFLLGIKYAINLASLKLPKEKEIIEKAYIDGRNDLINGKSIVVEGEYYRENYGE